MKNWYEVKEKRGALWSMKFLLILYHLLGWNLFRLILYPVVFCFYLASSGTRCISREYLNRINKLLGQEQKVNASQIYLHLFSFAFTLLEKLSAWSGKMHSSDMIEMTPDIHTLKEQLFQKKGAVIICSHLGNMEMLRAFADIEAGNYLPLFGIHSIVDFSGTEKFNKLLKEVNTQSMVELYNASDIGPDSIIRLQQFIQQGDLVIIAGDRTAKNNQLNSTVLDFLGEKAIFPQGSFLLASLLEGPIYYMFALRADDQDFKSSYEFYVYKSKFQFSTSRKLRRERVKKLTEEYVYYLENLCLKHPYQWFNFFDFWKKTAVHHKDRECG